MNSTYALYYGPNAENWDNCRMCQYELEQLGPLHGPEVPPPAGLDRYQMTPEEWAGGGIAVQNSPW